MVLLDRGPYVDSAIGLPSKGLEKAIHDNLCSRTCSLRLLDVSVNGKYNYAVVEA